MPIYTEDHYQSEVNSLELAVQACRADIQSTEGNLARLKAELGRKEDVLAAAKKIRDYHFPPQRPDFVTGGMTFEIKTTRRKRHELDEYIPHVIAFLENEKSAHYKNILVHLSKAMNEDMGEHQVYKALRRIIDHQLAPIQQDPKHKGYFQIIGDNDARPVTRESGRQNQIASMGNEAVTF